MMPNNAWVNRLGDTEFYSYLFSEFYEFSYLYDKCT